MKKEIPFAEAGFKESELTKFLTKTIDLEGGRSVTVGISKDGGFNVDIRRRMCSFRALVFGNYERSMGRSPVREGLRKKRGINRTKYETRLDSERMKCDCLSMILAEQLKKHRKRLGLTQAEVADLLDVSKRTYEYWENGRVPLKVTQEGVLNRLRRRNRA